MMAASRLGPGSIRLSEDAFVDELTAPAAEVGITCIRVRCARAYIDVNRAPYELDPAMFEDELPAFAQGRTARVAAGLGAIARVVGEGREIYARKLTFAEARLRIERVHEPYHAALAGLIHEARAAFGAALLIDWHSMPSAAARTAAVRGRRAPDMVLGDRFGAACAPGVTALVHRELERMGYVVTRNAPYAGGYTTELYGRPGEGAHALQIEINRALYLDEQRVQPHGGFPRLAGDLRRLFTSLARLDLQALV
jgi:N-formylglutamate amidohydrolase